MKNWPLSKKIALIAALFAVYFPIAVYFKQTYVPQPGPSKDMLWLTGPFLPFVAGGKAYLASLPKYEELVDTLEDMERSPIVLYENDRPLGPAHSWHKEIVDLGGGRYSHWRGLGIVFSTSDGSDPNKNWKLYSVRKPGPQAGSDNHDPGGNGKPPATKLTGPFLPFVAGGKAYLASLPKYEELVDTLEQMGRSPIILYENDRPLGPAHSLHQEIVDLGGGRYSHWGSLGIVFSTSDGSDPNKNSKLYSVRKPEPQVGSDNHDSGGNAKPPAAKQPAE